MYTLLWNTSYDEPIEKEVKEQTSGYTDDDEWVENFKPGNYFDWENIKKMQSEKDNY